MRSASATNTLRLAAGLSGHVDAVSAAEGVCEQCAGGLGAGAVDLAMVFVSSHHAEAMGEVAEVVRRTMSPGCLIGVSAEAVLGGAREVEGAPGVSMLAARLPGVTLRPFTGDRLLPYDEDSAEARERFARSFGAAPDTRATILFADPFSFPLVAVLPAMNAARFEGEDGRKAGVIVGGIASGGAKPGSNALLLDGQVYREGAVGVSIGGAVRIDTVVSQGCRAFGPNFIVTGARKNIILTLGGKPAMEAVREAIDELPERDRPLLEKGLFVGRVINEYKDRFGRDDFLIRNVMGVDPNTGAIAVSDFFRVGQTVRLHMRDAKTADEDLALLLDAQQLRERPAGGLLITCNGRGTRLFEQPNHDAAAVCRAFRPEPPAEQVAKGGEAIDPEAPTIPLAGFFGAGEIGPVGSESFLHGHTACLALFRSAP